LFWGGGGVPFFCGGGGGGGGGGVGGGGGGGLGWGDLAANARGDCYVVLPAGVEAFVAGETVRVLLR